MKNNFLRFEFKYLIPRFLLGDLKGDLAKLNFQEDSANNADGFYHVASVYFDTVTLSDYSDKIGGLLARKKLRARIYKKNDGEGSAPVWLEIKEKYDMMISKKRVALSLTEWQEFLQTPRLARQNLKSRLSESETKNLEEFMFWIDLENRRPYVLVEYKRSAWHLLSGKEKIRITLDYDIKAQKTKNLFADPTANVSQNNAVIEIKFSEKMPAQIGSLLAKYNLERVAYSKYAESVDSIRKFYPVPR
ncbi:MAG: polyphosphate polymerase domain-containing protein [Candidatus Liptonbacteria bacterium]|nr:polyphosphate polymerase domain-containing protein [Candidatus Liptonbacteria bacterium]